MFSPVTYIPVCISKEVYVPDILTYYFYPEGNIYTWGWGGSHGTFSEDGHSSGGQLVCFQLS